MLNTPNTPPYEFQSQHNHKNDLSPSSSIMNSPGNESSSTESDTETHPHSAFHRVMMLSPPELLLDTLDENIDQHGLLWSVRQRVSMDRLKKPSMKLSIPQKRVRPLRIQIPRPHWSHPSEPWFEKKPVPKKRKSPSTTSSSSGRPTRVKGPCQACQETSDGCMRKAFNWPFETNSVFNDKGKPFVYLCNKCGLRYNKSGGCVCRNCRWVLCKEERRKAMQLIDHMRSKRPDGRVDPEENIENFTCTPKYWNCSHPWKVGWILNSQQIIEEDDNDSLH